MKTRLLTFSLLLGSLAFYTTQVFILTILTWPFVITLMSNNPWWGKALLLSLLTITLGLPLVALTLALLTTLLTKNR